MGIIRSCKDCSDRVVGCHIDCERYKADTAANEAVKEAQRDYWLRKSIDVERSIRIRTKRVKRLCKDMTRKR